MKERVRKKERQRESDGQGDDSRIPYLRRYFNQRRCREMIRGDLIKSFFYTR
jgi:hypothetical protein